MKKLLLLLFAAALGTLAVSAYRGEPDGIFAHFKQWAQPYIQQAKQSVESKIAQVTGTSGGGPAIAAGDIDLSRASFHCNYSDAKGERVVKTYAPDRQGLRAVADVLSESGLKANFKVLSGDVPNASAFINDGERVIVYSSAWMQKLTESAQSKWAIYAVLAHEIGHHLNGDTMPKSGSYQSRSAGENHGQELAADFFAGFVLARLGASLDEATAAVRIYGGRESHTHPDRERRISAHTDGWKKGREGVAERTTTKPPSKELIDLRQELGRHAEHYGPGHALVGGELVPCVVQYKLVFDGRVMKAKGIVYDAKTRDVSIVEWSLDPTDGRPHPVSISATGTVDDADCYRIKIDNAGDFIYSVGPEEKGSRDPKAFVKLLEKYVALGAR